MTKTNTKRAVPTAQEFYKTKAGTKTYIALLLNSTLDMDTKVRTFDASMVNLGNFATQEIGITRATFYRHLKKLEEEGFIKREDDLIHIFPTTLYALIEKDTLRYLLNVANVNVVSIFAALQWRWDYFQKMGQPVYFTQTIILQDLGMVNNGKNQNMIKDVLNSLINEGLIKYVNHKTPKGNIVKQLTELNKSVKQNDIPTFDIDEEVEVLKASDFTVLSVEH